MTTKVGAAIDALVAVAQSVKAADEAVYDGPQVIDGIAKRFFGIGWTTDSDDGSGESADVVQEWASIGNRAKDERGTVHGVTSVWTGDTDAKGRRDVAVDMLSRFETALRADASLGMSLVRNAGLLSGALTQEQVEGGVRVYLAFDVAYTARI